MKYVWVFIGGVIVGVIVCFSIGYYAGKGKIDPRSDSEKNEPAEPAFNEENE